MNDEQKIKLADDILKYCKKFNIPLDYIFAILEDQKVSPMIRGKAMEYNAYLLLDAGLPKATWSVQKLNLNAQPGAYDQDISVVHRRTGITLKVESKSAARGSISTGKQARFIKKPHFTVKCHRSRSNIKLAGTSNDRYSVDSFDVLITNPLNSLFEGNTIGEDLQIYDDDELKKMLYKHYEVTNDVELVAKCETDWRFCFPSDIAEAGFIPRLPRVKLSNDPHWRPLSEIEARLLHAVDEKRKVIRRA
jgi:hypothetical protein